MARTIKHIVLHCSDSIYGDAALIKSWHLQRGFSDIGYHYVIQNGYPDADSVRLHRPRFWLDGVLENGRPVDLIGAHVKGANSDSVGICMVGVEQFTQSQFETLTDLLAMLTEDYPDAELVGHYELIKPGQSPKSCPNLDMDWVRGLVGG